MLLFEVDSWFGDVLKALSLFIPRCLALGAAPGHGGSFSVLLPQEVQNKIAPWINKPDQIEVAFSEISSLGRLRRDNWSTSPFGEFGVEALTQEDLTFLGYPVLAGMSFLMSVAGGSLTGVMTAAEERLCVVTVGPDASTIRLTYGTTENGTIPSRDFTAHLAAHAVNVQAGMKTSVVLHLHPQALIDLTRVQRMSGPEQLTSKLFRQRIEMREVLPEGVGFVGVGEPGSRRLVVSLAQQMKIHRTVALEKHGLTVRGNTIEQCLSWVEYLESAASSIFRIRAFNPRRRHESRLANSIDHFMREILEFFRPSRLATEGTEVMKEVSTMKSNYVSAAKILAACLSLLGGAALTSSVSRASSDEFLALFLLQLLLYGLGLLLLGILIRQKSRL